MPYFASAFIALHGASLFALPFIVKGGDALPDGFSVLCLLYGGLMIVAGVWAALDHAADNRRGR